MVHSKRPDEKPHDPLFEQSSCVAADPNTDAAGSRFGASRRGLFGGVTVYEPQKTEVYRHQTVDFAGFGETTGHS